MLRKRVLELFPRADLEVDEIEAGSHIATNKCKAGWVGDVRRKPDTARHGSLPPICGADHDFAMPTVDVDHLDRYRRAVVVVPDFVGLQAVKSRERVAWQEIVDRREDASRPSADIDGSIAPVYLCEVSTFGMRPQTECGNESLGFGVHTAAFS